MKKKILIIGIIFSSIVSSYSQKKISNQTKPNIIYIVADDLGYGDLGVNGQQKILTPVLDNMASEGMVFGQHYAGSSVCGPSRASLMTGRHMGHNTVRGNPSWTSTGKPVDIASTEVTVAEELKRAGYKTGVIGKWGLAEANDESMPLNQGFDYFYGYRDHGSAHHYYPAILWENKASFKTGNSTMEKKGTYSHDTFVGKAKEYIEANKKDPFFLYLAFTLPHFELTVPEDSKEPYKKLNWEERKLKVKPNVGYQHDADGNATYAGMVSRLDRSVGEVLKLLKTLGIDDNTIVIFTSDNGHEYDDNFFNSNGPFKGKKRDLYEGGIHVPFIARWPGHISPNSKTEHISAFWDFLPTVCDIAGIKPTDSNIDGISYLPTLLGKDKKQKKHAYLYWEFNENKGPIQAIRKENWKAVKYLNKPIELYNLSGDIGEENNVASTNPLIINEMSKILKEARTENTNFPLEFHKSIKP